MIDYIFYRLYRFYKKYPNESPVWSAAMYTSLLHIAILFSCFLIGDFFWDLHTILQKMSGNATTCLALSMAAFIGGYNVIKYRRNRIFKLIRKYHFSNRNTKIKTWMVFITCPMVFILAIVVRLIMNKFL